jgi:hypothetical protein
MYDDARHDAARRHVAALHADGNDVLVQPYLDAVDGAEAETALVFVDGALSHAMRKGPAAGSTAACPSGCSEPSR